MSASNGTASLTVSKWVVSGDGRRSCIVEDSTQPSNFRSVVVRLINGERWCIEINGAYRGYHYLQRIAKQIAVNYAKSDFAAQSASSQSKEG